MKYPNICSGIFKSRPNRFIAEVEINGVVERCHVKNTGRCRELLTPDATVYLNRVDASNRKTNFDLIAVEKGNLLINMDAQAPNTVFGEYVQKETFLPDLTLIRPEFRHGDSRFDFYLEQGEKRHLAEIKGVTPVEENGVAKFRRTDRTWHQAHQRADRRPHRVFTVDRVRHPNGGHDLLSTQ